MTSEENKTSPGPHDRAIGRKQQMTLIKYTENFTVTERDKKNKYAQASVIPTPELIPR